MSHRGTEPGQEQVVVFAWVVIAAIGAAIQAAELQREAGVAP